MTLKYVLPILTLTAAQVCAEEYQLLTNLQLSHVRAEYTGVMDDILYNEQYVENLWQLNGKYYFANKQTLGPLDQFEYINKVTNIDATISRFNDENLWTIGGEYFADNNFVISARYVENAGFHATSIGIGYLLTNNFIIRAQASKPEQGSTDYRFSASYNYQLQGNDYVGFSAYTDDEFDQYGVSSKYFASLGADRYIALGVSLAEDFDRSIWATNADYYFSKMTSVGVSYDKNDNYSLNAKHFFNQNWALNAGFGSNTDSSDTKVYNIGISGQF